MIYALDLLMVMMCTAVGIGFLRDGDGIKFSLRALIMAVIFAIPIKFAKRHIKDSTHRLEWYIYIFLLVFMFILNTLKIT